MYSIRIKTVYVQVFTLPGYMYSNDQLQSFHKNNVLIMHGYEASHVRQYLQNYIGYTAKLRKMPGEISCSTKQYSFLSIEAENCYYEMKI